MVAKPKRKDRPRTQVARAGRGAVGADRSDAFSTSLISAAANHFDPDDGVAVAGEWIGLEHDIANAEAIEVAALEVEHLEDEKRRLETAQRDVEAELKATPEWLASAAVNDARRKEGDARDVRFADWQLRHKIEAVVFAFGLIAISMTSLLTAQANLVGSGVPVFQEQPLLSWFIAALAPLSALAIKSMSTLFRRAPSRARFRFTIYFAAVASFLGWLALFSDQYHGLSASIDLFAEEDPGSDSLFILLQILTEVMVGASLALALERVAETYAPNFWIRNPDFDDLIARQTALGRERNTVVTKLGPARGVKARLEAERTKLQLEIGLAVRDRNARFDG